jgi:hypothetical protein
MRQPDQWLRNFAAEGMSIQMAKGVKQQPSWARVSLAFETGRSLYRHTHGNGANGSLSLPGSTPPALNEASGTSAREKSLAVQ